MTGQLAGRTAIVTGGASGLGRATVELFVHEGAQVVIADLDADRGEALAARLGPAAVFHRTDVAERAAVQGLVDFAVERFGTLHVMMNNAGTPGQRHSRFLDDPLSDFQRVMGINLYGVMVGSQCAARHMAANGGGAIINTASIAGVVAGYGVATYRASKAGVIQFSKSIAIDLAEYGVRVNCIAPGHIATEMTSRVDPDMSAETAQRVREALDPVWLSNQPLKARGKPEYVARAALYLASDLSEGVTGMVLPVDAGVTAGDPVNHMEALAQARARAIAGG
jgi:NAD(P)-dependent dehydrogenase (short-subunit alcohol dehydrogenase family)